MSTGKSEHRGRKALASGLLVALAGPPLGAVGMFVLSAVDEFPSLPDLEQATRALMLFLYIFVPFSYILGGVPAILAGLAIGIGIYKKGWIGWGHWIGLAVLLGFLTNVLMDGIQSRSISLLNPFAALFFIGPAVIASVVLRLLIIKFGWMRGPEAPAQPAVKT